MIQMILKLIDMECVLGIQKIEFLSLLIGNNLNLLKAYFWYKNRDSLIKGWH